MTTELEDTLARELTAVADGLRVPAVPSVGSTEGPRRTWVPPLLAAAAVLLVAGVLTVVLREQGGGTQQPATPSTPGTPAPTLHLGAPTVPYVLDGQLWVDGSPVPGDWASVESRGEVWLAQQTDGSWWSGGPGRDPAALRGQLDQPPAISPDGHYIAYVDLSSGEARLTGFDTAPAGEGFGEAPSDLPTAEDGVPIRVRAVTDDGDVIVQGTRTSLMWRALFEDQRTVVELAETAPDQVVLAGTAAGLVVVDGSTGATDATGTAPYVASISAAGVLTDEGPLPTYDDLAVSMGGDWLLRSPAGTLGGEVASVSTLRARPVAGGDEVVLTAPDGGGFASGTWAWEHGDTFVAVLLPDGATDESDATMVRCGVPSGVCAALPAPSAPDETDETDETDQPPTTYSAEQALGAVLDAAGADARVALLDPAVVGDGEWAQLVGYAAGEAGYVEPCRDNGEGTRDCEIAFDADPAAVYYAILEPAGNDYGWRVSYVGQAHD